MDKRGNMLNKIGIGLIICVMLSMSATALTCSEYEYCTTDNFQDNVLNTNYWSNITSGAGVTVETNQRLQFAYTAASDAGIIYPKKTYRNYNLTVDLYWKAAANGNTGIYAVTGNSTPQIGTYTAINPYFKWAIDADVPTNTFRIYYLNSSGGAQYWNNGTGTFQSASAGIPAVVQVWKQIQVIRNDTDTRFVFLDVNQTPLMTTSGINNTEMMFGNNSDQFVFGDGRTNANKIDMWADNYSVGYNTSITQTSCGFLDTSDGRYNLTANLASPGTCLFAVKNNISLIGNNKTVNYSQTSVGRAILAGNITNFTASNLSITQGDSTENAYAIELYNVTNSTLSYNYIQTLAPRCNGVRFTGGSTNITLTNNRFNLSVAEAFWVEPLTNNPEFYNHSIDESNTAHGKPIKYLWNVSNSTFRDATNYSFIYLTASNNVTLTNLTVSNGDNIGIGLVNNSNISFNNILNATARGGIKAYPFVINNTIRNNTITSNGTKSFGFYMDGGEGDLGGKATDNLIYGNTITTYGDNGYCLYPFAVRNNTFRENSCITYGANGIGIFLQQDWNNTFENNTIITNAASVPALYEYTLSPSTSSYDNIFNGDTFLSAADFYDIWLDVDENDFLNINMTSGRYIYLASNTTYFNQSQGSSVWMRTNIPGATITRRNISNWNATNLSWEETPDGVQMYYYVIKGLLPLTVYNVTANSTLIAIIATDSTGATSYNVILSSNTNLVLSLYSGTPATVASSFRNNCTSITDNLYTIVILFSVAFIAIGLGLIYPAIKSTSRDGTTVSLLTISAGIGSIIAGVVGLIIGSYLLATVISILC